MESELDYSKVSGVHLAGVRQFPDLLHIEPGSLKVRDGMVTFTCTVPESFVGSLYVAPADRPVAL